ncbi:HIG1 domain family member 2A, mitochondrial [Geodia barretti]|jgi:hypothetical protein|uniref:HIG1 domain family member 2A, mitochondrial n=1 Tax=Geodia barretti TaxID=519541 RepID=A0AA35T4W3_GEOBA|nr:HIG1 domain family member 2A, mitochondrial [Geodia barretti]
MPETGSTSLAPPTDVELSREDYSWLTPEPETPAKKMSRKVMANPLVPIGCGLTVAALVYGLTQFKRGNQRSSQMAMRMRVLAQGGTIIAVLGGLMVSGAVERRDK